MEPIDINGLAKEDDPDDVSTLEEEFLKMVANLEFESVAMEEEGTVNNYYLDNSKRIQLHPPDPP